MKLIELVNASVQSSLAAGSSLNLGNIDKSVCQCAYEYNGVDTLTFKQQGYYILLFKADATSTAATQQMTLSVSANGTTSNNVDGTALGTAIGDTFTITFFKIVKVGSTPLAIKIVNSGTTATTFDNTILSAFKIA